MKRFSPFHGLVFVPFLVAAAACSSDDEGGGGSAGAGASNAGEPAVMQGITAAHNEARAAVDPPAPEPLPPLVWSPEIAAVAQGYAEKCVWEHSDNEYGENLYASSGGSTAAQVVSNWVSEEADYIYASNECSAVCGHYTQVVWANTTKLGCGMAKCSTGSPFGGGDWEYWVCNYDPPGNYVGQKPY
ncbi:CAP domain-containing protein [Polyangium spumosum]|uniref:Fis family transcriptional regulator n=1 Tax=Polyangium spumosum TaxID=889282 RepID=A0A6N7PYM2_9BACT|nr:CAP domain-containing protein [Polyangium spumosum]MRG95375.1 Fis family transcriptional regulator [Polyangium spumosum]